MRCVQCLELKRDTDQIKNEVTNMIRRFQDIEDERAYGCILEVRHELKQAVFHLENAIGHAHKNGARQKDIMGIRIDMVMLVPRVEAMLAAMMDDVESTEGEEP